MPIVLPTGRTTIRKIIPLLLSLFIVIPYRYVPTTVSLSPLLGFPFDYGGILRRVTFLLAMRLKYGARIPKYLHTQRLPEIAVLRDILSSDVHRHRLLCYTESVRPLRRNVVSNYFYRDVGTSRDDTRHDGMEREEKRRGEEKRRDKTKRDAVFVARDRAFYASRREAEVDNGDDDDEDDGSPRGCDARCIRRPDGGRMTAWPANGGTRD
ncbi:hypothetical protein ALC53_09511 [Atta colombica]|uniref:Uncharacterized protein n=1 Tax=Atta colombica TaxID=520822 RepID=A0A195B6U7_9HYME|nr:hypothetical protein ALC53_09511 [Atta colombica]